MRKIITAVALLFLCGSAGAQDAARLQQMTGNDFNMLTHGDSMNRTLLFFSLVSAIKADHNLASMICAPENVTLAQGAKIIDKFMDDHPELLHETMRNLSFASLYIAFPCPK